MIKKISFVLLLLFISISLFLPVFASDPGYIVDFSNPEGLDSFLDNLEKDKYPIKTSTGTNYTTHGMFIEYTDIFGNGLGEFRWTVDFNYNEEDRCVSFTGKEEELQTRQKDDLRLSVYTEFVAAEFPHVVVCYRITSGARISSNSIYLRDDRHNLEYSSETGTWTPNRLIADGEWNYRILDLSEELSGIHKYCMGIRMPICKNAGDSFDLKFIAAFAEKEDAINFDIQAYDAYYETVKPEATLEPEVTDRPQEPASPKSNPLMPVLFVAIALVLVVSVYLIYRFFSKRI